MALNRAAMSFGIGLISFALMGMGAQEPVPEKITLKLDPKVDQRFEYVISMDLDLGKNGTLRGSLTTADRILEVGEKNYTARHYIADAKYVGTKTQVELAEALESEKGTQAEHTVDFRGKLVAVDGIDDPTPANFDLILPPNPVAAGDTWDEKLHLEQNGVEVSVKFKLESFTETEATISAAGTSVAGYRFDKPHIYTVDRKTGKMLSGEAQMVMSYGGLEVNTKMKTTLLSPNLRKKN